MAQAPLPTAKVGHWFRNASVRRLLQSISQSQTRGLPKLRWHYLYYVLAAFDLLAISASLYLNHQITTIYTRSVQVNQEWANRLHHYSVLDQLASAVNMPGNNIFDSQNVKLEAEKLSVALHHFNEQVRVLRQDLRVNVDQAQADLLLKDLDILEQTMTKMVSEAVLIFSDFRQNQPERAGRRMAAMDRQYHQLNQVMGKLSQDVGTIQQQVFAQQKQDTKILQLYEVAIAGFILVMIVSVTVYGHQLAQQVQVSNQEREESFQKLQQAEAFLREQTAQLERSFNGLQAMQARLVESEKMSALGVMVAGVAHEINNPVNFIHGNLKHAEEYFQDLLELLNLYQKQSPSSVAQIQKKVEEIDIDFIKEDLPKLLNSMQIGTDRIREIVKSLRTFSRLDEAEFKAASLHEGLDSTLMILNSRLKEKPGFSGIEVIKEYGSLPFVDCYPGQLNQVFMNILSNAIDALEEKEHNHASSFAIDPLEETAEFQIQRSPSTHPAHHSGGTEGTENHCSPHPTITIRTEVLPHNSVAIRIADNGPGIPEPARSKIFNPFFTTKPVGKGTGLGLSISYKIVVEKHGGRLQCHSKPGQGTEFVIEIPILQPEPAPAHPGSCLPPKSAIPCAVVNQ